MPTPSERKALLFIGLAALLGVAVRVTQSEVVPRPTVGDLAALRHQVAAVESARGARGRHRGDGSTRQGVRGRDARGGGGGIRPAKVYAVTDLAGGPIDMDRAGADDMLVLPHIGDRLAHRIVADRDSLGAFGSLAGLRRVRGVGPAVVEDIAPLVTFSGTPRLTFAPTPGYGTAAARDRVPRRRALRSP
ncbi:MAG: hypothetical protein NVS9B3_06890 [Gemmatimonadaceae bacterium]